MIRGNTGPKGTRSTLADLANVDMALQSFNPSNSATLGGSNNGSRGVVVQVNVQNVSNVDVFPKMHQLKPLLGSGSD